MDSAYATLVSLEAKRWVRLNSPHTCTLLLNSSKKPMSEAWPKRHASLEAGSMTEKERLEIQARSFEFYAGLIERAVGRGAPLPVWGPMTAEEYRQLAQEYRQRAARLAEQEQAQAPKKVDEASVSLQKGATTH
jgi:hypothetical protein